MASVYVFQHGDEDLFKIGRTRGDVEKRRKDLSTGNPVELKIFDVIETEKDNVVEKYLHKKLYAFHSKASDATEFFAVSTAILQECIQETREFMDEYLPLLDAAEELKKIEPDDSIKKPDEHVLQVYEELCRVRERMSILKFEEEILENKIKSYIGGSNGIEGVATWVLRSSLRLDQAILKEKFPEAYDQCQIESKTRFFKLE